VPTTLGELTSFGTAAHYPRAKRFIADNMWTHASFDDLQPGLKSIQPAKRTAATNSPSIRASHPRLRA
jgi:hypothetical protein